MPEIELSGHKVSYEIRKSNRTRRVHLTINPVQGLVVVIPAGYDVRRIPEILHDKTKWILKHYKAATEWKPAGELCNGQQLLFAGQPVILTIQTASEATKRSTVLLEANIIHLTLRPCDKMQARQILETWLRECAREYIIDELNLLSIQRSFEYNRIFIKDQRTRWGSCSIRGNLSFNWRLVMAPREVLRYVVAHEVAHLAEHNHGEKFWQIVTELVGDTAGPKKWLREHGAKLRM